MGNKLPRPPREPLDPELTKVHGLYPSCEWDEHRVRRLINDRRLAPCFVGAESDSSDASLEECPICMYFYPAMNRTTCCRKSICTECYLQIAPEKKCASAACPYCKKKRLALTYAGPRSEAEVREELAQREALVEVQIRMLQEALRSSSPEDDRKPANAASSTASSCRTSSPSASPRLSTPLPSPELLASSPRAAELLASAEVASPLMLAVSTPGRAPPLSLDCGTDDGDEYAERWRKAQEKQLAASVNSAHALSSLPPPPEVRPPPRTIEGIVGTAALSGSMAGWSHSEAEDVEELMLLEAIRLSLEQQQAQQPPAPSEGEGGGAGGGDGDGGEGSADMQQRSAASDAPADESPESMASELLTSMADAVSATATSLNLQAAQAQRLPEPIAS